MKVNEKDVLKAIDKALENITCKEKVQNKVLDYKDIVSISRTMELPDKIITAVKFADGTETKVVLNNLSDSDDKEKAIMWCLLKKCFSSKRGLERIIYAMEDM